MIVRRHIAEGVYRTLITVKSSLRLYLLAVMTFVIGEIYNICDISIVSKNKQKTAMRK